jgi:hypothetical protein
MKQCIFARRGFRGVLVAAALTGTLVCTGSFRSGAVIAGFDGKEKSRAGGPDEPVRYVGNERADPTHNGGLRLAVGVKNFQAFRANRTHPELAEDSGWTYNHAPMLAYWNDRFYLEYLSSPVNENFSPMQTLLTRSVDGVNWEKPRVVFPQYSLPNGRIALMHQRMGFYVAPNGRLLVLGFYGLGRGTGLLKGSGEEISDPGKLNPNDGTGVGRVVREAHPDGSFGNIYFIRYNSHNGWNETNTLFPFYTTSSDAGFKDACKALLANRLVTMQWWEEERVTNDPFYYPMGQALKALSFYHRKDGTVAGFWKSSWASLSKDEGKTWSKPVQVPSLIMAEAKVWGQRMPDGRYALLYNPRADNRHRWPLAIVTSDDGIHFDDLLTVVGEVPPRRYNGTDKAFGPQYVRGIVEGNQTPPGNAFWVTFSMNKDDVWVSRVPVPVKGRVEQPVKDTFDQGSLFDLEWNLYSPRWAPVRIADFPSSSNRSLELRDTEPHDYARAERVFPGAKELAVNFRVLARQAETGRLEIELLDRYGNRPPVCIHFDEKGRVLALDGNRNDPVLLTNYRPETWYDFSVKANVDTDLFDVTLNGKPVLKNSEFLDPVESLERISLRTGPYRIEPVLRTPKSPGKDVPEPDEPVPPAVFCIDDLEIQVVRAAD